ncbi:Gfo/Idh/MocA family oxidoreductase [Nocardia bovistercoris]|uniref:Gfo/Idh/MocA family oxidoreductase n=1 Tax=Nocardia bovistercoris TaxID=2785916 RepID=A0A931I7R2_9NOCA|nr:Gfo/Idh/MocA family oxidoreductase [Nocardia bovistercoris]MBH0776487.1 Gfo/Idh/MocA family oxidoreductase [Nocardia bovistercoris]
MRSVEVAVIGFGLAGSVFHAPLIAAQPRMRVAAVVTGSAERAESARRAYPGVRIVPDTDALFADPGGIDLVVIASPNRTHAPLALRAVRAGIATVVDKPFALSAKEARTMAAAARETGVPLSVFQNRRWDNDFLTVRDLLDSGRLGSVRRFESRFERWRPVSKGSWREIGAAEEGAGVLFDLGPHLVDQAYALFGPVDSVYCELDRRRAEVRTDDDAFVALTHTNGVRSHLWASAVTPLLGPRFRVLGSEAGFVCHGLDPQENALRAGRAPGEPGWGTGESVRHGTLGTENQTSPHPLRAGDYPAFYTAMAAAVLDDAPVPVTPEDAVATTDILAAARRSAADRQTIRL